LQWLDLYWRFRRGLEEKPSLLNANRDFSRNAGTWSAPSRIADQLAYVGRAFQKLDVVPVARHDQVRARGKIRSRVAIEETPVLTWLV
jgi:hypothetical protein